MRFITLVTAITVTATECYAFDIKPQVDLGYEIYKGDLNQLTGLDVFKGIRFAAAPIGPLRWQAPQPPLINRASVIPATSFGAICPQSARSGLESGVSPSPVDEDCLFLNVYAPHNATGLPVLVWIHGGGYGVGNGREDMSRLINANDNGFIGLGAFGFLAGDEVFHNGVVNAGLLDQQFAFKWVQQHIHRFGGDPRRVTIWGLSAGGGSVMLHNIAYNGTLGTSLFANVRLYPPQPHTPCEPSNTIQPVHRRPPFLPQQHHYNAPDPSTSYHAFATQAGCPTLQNPTPNHDNKTSQSLFDCLISKPTSALQAASNLVSKSGRYGTWAFQPVTDSTFISSAPSTALQAGHINGVAMLTSNAAEESFAYVPQNITTTPSFFTWLATELPFLTTTDISSLLTFYPLPLFSNSSIPRFATPGIAREQTGTALSTSATASGLQQLANLIHAERTFICPSYWLAESFSAHSRGGRGWKLQFSIPVAVHAVDEQLAFGNRLLPSQGEEVVRWVQRLWGGFVSSGDPGLLGTGGVGNWTPYTFDRPAMLNVNQTGGIRQPVNASLSPFLQGVDADWYVGPGLRGKLEVVDGKAWEGGRGERCEFWRGMGA